MFIPTSLTDAPGLKAELDAWKAITLAFDEKSALAIHHYPMFFSNGAGRREIDILIVHPQLGVCVIEVKGININQLKGIEGHKWTYKDYYEDQSSPFEQAENQLNMLCSFLEENPILYRRFSKRVFVALPYISEKEWQERGFHKQINSPTPLFKEDFTDLNHLLKKMQSSYLKEVKGNLSNFEFKKISQALGIHKQEANQPKLKSYLPFSHTYILQTRDDFERYKQDITQALQNGTKVYLLIYTDIQLSAIKDADQYIDSFQLNIYKGVLTDNPPLDSECFIDGENISESLLTELAAQFPSFNTGQFKVIHQPIDSHQMITAGAGTGKTHVMIDRILFLLLKGGVPLEQIIMITFTNASTNEMKKRLEEKFITLFHLTRQSQFLLFAEEVKDMQISTIHSFARSILKQLAHEIGYGQNVQLRSYKFVKKSIIHELLDQFFSARSVEPFLQTRIKDYEFIDLVYAMWEEMEKKGLSTEEIQNIDWGTVTGTDATIIHEILQFIFKRCEAMLDELKHAENSITMGDLIRKLKLFTGSRDKMKQLSKDRYIFVDEFQDSDAVQIELLASLQKFLQYKLFVVGDIKQAIYRFRGADYKSFQELEDTTKGIKYVKTELQLNYRSSGQLLNKMHPLFKSWNDRGWLTYEKLDRLLSDKETEFQNDDWNVSLNYEEDFERALASLPSKKDKIAFIVRTNRQAKRIKEFCESKNIPTTENLDGTFFISKPVLDLKALLDGLLYPNEPKFLINAMETPYFGYKIPYHLLVQFSGDKKRISSFIHAKTSDQFKKYVNLLRNLAPMTVIQKIIFENQLFARLPEYIKQTLKSNVDNSPAQENIKLSVLRYEKNLQHLMILIERSFAAQNLTLQTLRDWLQLQISTNRTENEPLLDQDTSQVEITTVHRSKGLEYHTVFLPITNSPFNAVEQQYFLEEASENTRQAGKRKFGWQIKVKDKPKYAVYMNNYFETLKTYEDQEQFKEETRLLYVALTRAEQRIYITMPKLHKIPNESWAFILSQGGLIAGLEEFK
ncbi:MAG: UvrD-helicase domain-containing protein [Bacillota bacterium]